MFQRQATTCSVLLLHDLGMMGGVISANSCIRPIRPQMCRSSGLFGDFVGPARHRQMPAAALIKNCLLFGQIAEAAGRQPGNWTVKSRLFLLRRPSLPSCLARLYDLPNAIRIHRSASTGFRTGLLQGLFCGSDVPENTTRETLNQRMDASLRAPCGESLLKTTVSDLQELLETAGPTHPCPRIGACRDLSALHR